MSKSLIVSLAASLVVLAGCANPPRSVERPYSDAEIKSYALDSLERSNLLWGGGSFGAGERVASDGWRTDAARVSGVSASNIQPNRNGVDCEIPARF
ncbi:TPA: hypothetical protein OMK07_001965 [Pseudomonas aeruginosa]|uniref:hypothetical protein n=1 Tax=Pseudomonas aeruginosa TaxID=287 RepID=UPI0037110E69|nr:hypothetical protein [Pseudomonas aeruginosa]